MASSATGGLTRRRGGAAAGNGNEDGRVSSPAPKRTDDRTPETSYENSENGHKIAFDPRDISESAERNKQPKLTLMEEVILMGLKDKQVGCCVGKCISGYALTWWLGIPLILERQHIICAPRMYRHRAGV
jgi:hypothetical protein